MELTENFIPFDIETVHFFDMGLLYFLEFRFVTIPDFLYFTFFSQFFEGLDFAFTAFGLDVLASVLILFLLHDEFIASYLMKCSTWFRRVY